MSSDNLGLRRTVLGDSLEYILLAQTYINYGEVISSIEKYEVAIELFKRALDYAKLCNDCRMECKVTYKIARAYDSCNNFVLARKYYTRSLKLSEELDDIERQANIYWCLTILHTISSEYVEALNSAKIHYILRRKLGDHKHQLIARNHIDRLNKMLGLPHIIDKDLLVPRLVYFDDEAHSSKYADNQILLWQERNSQACDLFQTNRYYEAIDSHKKNIILARDILKNNNAEAQSLYGLGICLKKLKRYNEAANTFRKVIETLDNFNNYYMERHAINHLQDIYQKKFNSFDNINRFVLFTSKANSDKLDRVICNSDEILPQIMEYRKQFEMMSQKIMYIIRSLELHTKARDMRLFRLQLLASSNLGKEYFEIDLMQRAKHYYNFALEISILLNDEDVRPLIAFGLYKLYKIFGDLHTARDTLRKSPILDLIVNDIRSKYLLLANRSECLIMGNRQRAFRHSLDLFSIERSLEYKLSLVHSAKDIADVIYRIYEGEIDEELLIDLEHRSRAIGGLCKITPDSN